MANRSGYIIGGLAGMAAIGLVVAVIVATPDEPKRSGTTNSPAVAGQATSQMGQAIAEVASHKAVLVDVRTTAEFASGHAAGAINFAVERLQAGELPEGIAKDAKVYLYCHSGRRAGLAMPILKNAGYQDVTNLGAFQAWLDAGGPKA